MLMDNIKFERNPDISEMEMLNHCVVHGMSYEAWATDERELPLCVCSGDDGWYIGAKEPETEQPQYRDSAETWVIFEDAVMVLTERRWTQLLDWHKK